MVFEDTGRMGVKKAASSFVAGLVMTLILVIAVPIVVNQYISGYVSEAVGETSFLFLTSEMLILLIIWLILFAFMFFLGAGGILKRCGIFGIIGLVAAYWLIGDVTDAVMPLAVLAVVLVITWNIGLKKKAKAEAKDGE